MKLSTRSEYACLALVDLAEHAQDSAYIKIQDICNRKSIPNKYLEQLCMKLKRAGFIKSRKGQEGGYALAKPSETITVAEIIRLMDGALAPVESVSKYFYAHSPIELCPKLLGNMREIRDYISNKLENLTLNQLIDKE